jgi:SRSO17 transposase
MAGLFRNSRGRALLDRELYLPESWTKDPERCRKAGIPTEIGFRTKPALLQTMVMRALGEGVEARWLAADSVYGDDPQLRADLEEERLGYVMATSKNDAALPIGIGQKPLSGVIADQDPSAWQRLSAGAGSQGPRLYDWQLVELSTFPDPRWRRGLLVQRNISDPTEIKVHRCFYPVEPPCRPWSRSPAVAGRSRPTSRQQRGRSDSINTKSAVGAAGTATRAWPSWPTPSWR